MIPTMIALVLVIAVTVVVAVVVVGLHVWGAIMDGREEREMYARRHPPR
jgi:hypothetical protein